MSRHSLRLRILLVSVFSICAALILAGIVLVELFERHVERRIDTELSSHIRQLAGHIGFDSGGQLSLSGKLADPRFAKALSGLYWQLQEDATASHLRSRSLWDFVLALPVDEPQAGIIHHHRLAGPAGTPLITQERRIIYDTTTGARTIRIAVALDARTVDQAATEFASDIRMPLFSLSGFLIAVAVIQIWFGLLPLEAVRRGIKRIHTGDLQRLDGPFPDEVMPLISEMNTLLDTQDRTIERARHQAANLAHALKTPLTVIMSNAQKLKDNGQSEIGDELADLSLQMRHYIDRQLTRARMANEAVSRDLNKTDIVAITQSVIGALNRTPSGEALNWELDAPSACRVAVDVNDLCDLVGNLLDNASKWARTCVDVSIIRNAGEVVFTVTDDGPGAPPEQLEDLHRRGTRLDENKPGSGIGLAIVNDIVTAYGGNVSLQSPGTGGFSVSVHLPELETTTI